MCVSTAQLYDKIAPAAPHALHMPSHIYSTPLHARGFCPVTLSPLESLSGQLVRRKIPDAGPHPSVHDLLHLHVMTAYLQTTKDGDAKQVVDPVLFSPQRKKFPFVTSLPRPTPPWPPFQRALPSTADRWDEAAQLPVRDSQYRGSAVDHLLCPCARRRALGQCAAAARADIADLDEIETKLASRQRTSIGWDTDGSRSMPQPRGSRWSEGQRDTAIAEMRRAADLERRQ